MSNPKPESQMPPNIERHIQTVISLLAVGLLGWVGVTLNGLQQSVTRLEEQIRNSSAQVNANDFRINTLQSELVDIIIRIDRLEQRQIR